MTTETKTTVRCDASGCDAEFSVLHDSSLASDPNRKPTVLRIIVTMGAIEWRADLCFGHRDALKRAIDKLMVDYKTS